MKPLTLYGRYLYPKDLPAEMLDWGVYTFAAPASVCVRTSTISVVDAAGNHFEALRDDEFNYGQGLTPNDLSVLMWRRGNDE